MDNLPSLSEMLTASKVAGPGEVMDGVLSNDHQMAQDAQARSKAKQDFLAKLTELGIGKQKANADTMTAETGRLAEEKKPKPLTVDDFKTDPNTGSITLNPRPGQTYDQSIGAAAVKGSASMAGNAARDEEKKALQNAKDAQSLAKRVGAAYEDRSNTGLGGMEMKVNAAKQVHDNMNNFFDAKSGKFIVPPGYYTDFLLDYAKMLAPNANMGIELVHEMKQPSSQAEVAKGLSFISKHFRGTELGSEPDDVMKKLADQVYEVGSTAEGIRDNYTQGLANGAGYRRLRLDAPDDYNDAMQNYRVTHFREAADKSPYRTWLAAQQQANKQQPGLGGQRPTVPQAPQPILGKTPSFASEQDAEAANLPRGTVILIGGRKAMVP